MERRFQQDAEDGEPLNVPCRHCWEHQPLDPSRLELTEGRAWHRCIACNEWFLVRWEDAQKAMGSA